MYEVSVVDAMIQVMRITLVSPRYTHDHDQPAFHPSSLGPMVSSLWASARSGASAGSFCTYSLSSSSYRGILCTGSSMWCCRVRLPEASLSLGSGERGQEGEGTESRVPDLSGVPNLGK